jgi:hypothetical protein
VVVVVVVVVVVDVVVVDVVVVGAVVGVVAGKEGWSSLRCPPPFLQGRCW